MNFGQKVVKDGGVNDLGQALKGQFSKVGRPSNPYNPGGFKGCFDGLNPAWLHNGVGVDAADNLACCRVKAGISRIRNPLNCFPNNFYLKTFGNFYSFVPTIVVDNNNLVGLNCLSRDGRKAVANEFFLVVGGNDYRDFHKAIIIVAEEFR